jgi:hypothetical protein
VKTNIVFVKKEHLNKNHRCGSDIDIMMDGTNMAAEALAQALRRLKTQFHF